MCVKADAKCANDDSRHEMTNTELFCPICNDLFVYPRSYSCGHTLCEMCMIKMDKIDFFSIFTIHII